MEEKIKVYVSSFRGISTLDYVDKDSMGHPCVTSQHGENIFAGFKHLPQGSLDGYLTEDQVKAVEVVDEFCEEHGLEYEVVDLTTLSFVRKMKFIFRRTKAPTTSFKGKQIEGIPTIEGLKALVSK